MVGQPGFALPVGVVAIRHVLCEGCRCERVVEAVAINASKPRVLPMLAPVLLAPQVAVATGGQLAEILRAVELLSWCVKQRLASVEVADDQGPLIGVPP